MLSMLDHGVLIRLGDILPGRAPCADADRADLLVDRLVHRTLESMRDAELMSARLAESPWSDDYWAIYLGMLGKRYADEQFPGASDWHVNYDYIQRHPASGTSWLAATRPRSTACRRPRSTTSSSATPAWA
jgi:hypothetical protein